MSKRVLVSGGAGYIGSHVTVELIQAGYDVLVADDMSNCDLTCFEGVKKITGRDDLPFVKMSFCDEAATEKLFTDWKIDAVIHFAAFKAVGESVEDPLKYYGNNLNSFVNVIGAARRHGCKNILFSSSATVYGEPDKQPVTEQTPRKPSTSPYGNTKQICEDILRDCVAAYPEIRGIALALLQPYRRTSVSIDWRASARSPQQPGALHHPDRCRPQGMPEHLWQRLPYPGRHLPEGLHRHRRSGPCTCMCSCPYAGR